MFHIKRRKILVRTVIIAIIVILLGSSFTVAGAAEKNPSMDEAFLSQYIANLAFEEGGNPINNGVPGYKDVVSRKHNIGHPSGIYINELNQDDVFMCMVNAYDGLTVDPSKFAEDAISETEFYTAILLALLNVATTNDAAIEAYESKWTETSAEAGSWLLEGIKEQYNITISGGTKIANVDRDKLKTYMQKMLQDKYNIADGAAKGIELFNYYIETVSTVQDIINIMTSYICIYNAERETFAVLREMREHTSRISMKNALDKIIECEDDALAAIDSAIKDSGNAAAETVYEVTIGGMWSKAALASPAAPLYLAQKTAKAICEICFSTDAISEQYWKMSALCNVEAALHDASASLGKAYVGDQTADNARNYNRSVEMYFNIYDLSCEYAKTYVDIIYKQAIAGMLKDEDKYNKVISQINSIQTSNRTDYELWQENYICYLDEDYPEIYEKLTASGLSSGIAVTGISVTKDTLEWGTDDMIVGVPYTITPSNATNTLVEFSVADETETVVSCENDRFKVLKAGTTTVTVTTVDGGFSDTVTINAVEGHGADGLPLSDPSTSSNSIVESGQCGKNVYYRLMKNGTMYITGTGEMYDYGGHVYYMFTAGSASEESRRKKRVKEIIIGNGVTKIGGFYRFENLNSVIIPESVKTIGDYAFYDCTKLNATIPKSITTIEEYAFAGCRELDMEISSNITTIGNGAFIGCSGLTSIYIGDDTTLGKNPFGGCYNLKEINVSADNAAYVSVNGILFNKDKTVLIQYPCGKQEKTYTIPNGVIDIGYSAFYGGGDLETVKIPEGIVKIGDLAFYECDGLKNVELPSSLEIIGDSAFYSCSDLSNIILPRNMTKIGESAFSECESLTNVIVPGGVETIEKYAFNWCENLESVKIEDGVEVIDTGAFSQCDKLIEIIMPNSLRDIRESAFYGCDALISVEIPEGVSYIGETAFGKGFYDDNSLVSVTIPSSVTSIAQDAFEDRYGLIVYGYTYSYAETYAKEHDIPFISIGVMDDSSKPTDNPSGNEDQGGNQNGTDSDPDEGDVPGDNGSKVDGVELPSTVLPAAGAVLKDNTGAAQYEITVSAKDAAEVSYKAPVSKKKATVKIPDTVTLENGTKAKVTAIEAKAFKNNKKIKKVIIGKNIETIGNEAFSGCKNLKSITIKTTKLKSSGIGKKAFKGVSSKAKVKVPKTTVKVYKKLLVKKGLSKKAKVIK